MTFKEYKEHIEEYGTDLHDMQRKADKTIKAYIADLKQLENFFTAAEYTDDHEITGNDIDSYTKTMQTEGKSTATINRRIISINKYLKAYGAHRAATVPTINRQDNSFNLTGVISFKEYERMLNAALTPSPQAAKAGLKPDPQAWAIMQTLAGTGIRFNELQFFTVENIRACPRNGDTITVNNKGKQRAVIVDKSLQKLLKDYCTQQGITSGYIFGTRNGTPISNEQISRRLKKIAGYARISKEKIHPHSFRHLFAQTYMEHHDRLDDLADILGHSSINTTRIYSRTSPKEKSEKVSNMGMIIRNDKKSRKK